MHNQGRLSPLPACCPQACGTHEWTDSVTGDPYRYSDEKTFGSDAWTYYCDQTYNMVPAYFASPAEMARIEAAFKARKSDFDTVNYWFGLT